MSKRRTLGFLWPAILTSTVSSVWSTEGSWKLSSDVLGDRMYGNVVGRSARRCHPGLGMPRHGRPHLIGQKATGGGGRSASRESSPTQVGGVGLGRATAIRARKKTPHQNFDLQFASQLSEPQPSLATHRHNGKLRPIARRPAPDGVGTVTEEIPPARAAQSPQDASEGRQGTV